MRTFKDNADRDWTLAVNVQSLKRVKDLLAVDLTRLNEGDPPLITRLSTDVILICDVIFALVKPEADAKQVTDEEFGRGMGGDALSSAYRAFTEELSDFFQKLGRSDLAQVVTTQNRMVEAAVSATRQKIEAIDLKALIAQTFGD